jgi:hypothetical protein
LADNPRLESRGIATESVGALSAETIESAPLDPVNSVTPMRRRPVRAGRADNAPIGEAHITLNVTLQRVAELAAKGTNVLVVLERRMPILEATSDEVDAMLQTLDLG